MCRTAAGITTCIKANLGGGKASEHSRGFALEKISKKKKTKQNKHKKNDYPEYFGLVKSNYSTNEQLNKCVHLFCHFLHAAVLGSGGTAGSELPAEAAASCRRGREVCGLRGY